MTSSENEKRIQQWLFQDAYRMDALQAAASLNLNDWWLAAGFVRNLIWDRLHDKPNSTPLNDIDLIYFNSNTIDPEADQQIEHQLKQLTSHPWSVKNQARMHIRNDDAPYLCCADAMSYWPEMQTAIGARLNATDEIRLTAPFGIDKNFDFTVTANSKRLKPETFKQRIESKKWLSIWPKLAINYNNRA